MIQRTTPLRLASLTLVATMSAAMAFHADAHSETIIAIATDGTMSGLPPEYQPAQLVISKSAGIKVPTVALTLSGKTVEFPACLAKLFAIPAGQRMGALASWYHEPRGDEKQIPPPYLIVYLPHRTTGGPWNLVSGHSIMFDLRAAEISELYLSPPGSS